MNKRQHHYLGRIHDKQELTDAQFREMIINFLLGEGFYIADPVTQPRANKICIEEIIKKYKGDKHYD